MYTKNEIKNIIKENRFKTKVCQTGRKECLILVPNFKEYYTFFHPKTMTCYAHSEKSWGRYHRDKDIYKEFVYLSTDEVNVEKKFSYITFCVSNIKTTQTKRNAKITGNVMFHDLDHDPLYPIIKFDADFIKFTPTGPWSINDFPSLNIDYRMVNEHLLNFVNFENKRFKHRGIIRAIFEALANDILINIK